MHYQCTKYVSCFFDRKQIVEDEKIGESDFVLVLEDDFTTYPKARKQLEQILDACDRKFGTKHEHCDIVYVGSNLPLKESTAFTRPCLGSKKTAVESNTVNLKPGCISTTLSYLITKAGARRLLRELFPIRWLSIDQALQCFYYFHSGCYYVENFVFLPHQELSKLSTIEN
jgi:GR25 family glycosyltransferase involved in LPS biosynthesis